MHRFLILVLFTLSLSATNVFAAHVVYSDADLQGDYAITLSESLAELPHVLMLTAIVVGVAVTAVGLALIVRIHAAYGTVDDAEIRRIDEEGND